MPLHPMQGDHSPQKFWHNVLIFRQKSASMGQTELYLHEKGATFIARGGDLVAVCCAPDWRLVFHTKGRNLAYDVDYKKMQEHSLGLIHKPALEKGLISHSFNRTLSLHTENIKLAGSAEPDGSKDSFFFQTRRARQFDHIDFADADEIHLESHLQTFVNWIYDMGNRKGVPLELKKYFTDGSREVTYETLSVTRADKPADLFTYPTGYKTTERSYDILMSEDPRSTLEDLLGPAK